MIIFISIVCILFSICPIPLFSGENPIVLPLLSEARLVKCTGGTVKMEGNVLTLEITPPAVAVTAHFILPPRDIKIYDRFQYQLLGGAAAVYKTSAKIFTDDNGILANAIGFKRKKGSLIFTKIPDVGCSKTVMGLKVEATRKPKDKIAPGEKFDVVLCGFSLYSNGTALTSSLKIPSYDGIQRSPAMEKIRRDLISSYGEKLEKWKTEPTESARRALITELYTLQNEKLWQFEQDMLRTAAGDRPLAYVATNGIDKIRRDSPVPSGEFMGKFTVSLAKNETEGAQLLLYPLRGMRNVEVLCSPLIHHKDSGKRMEQVTVAPVGYGRNNAPVYYRKDRAEYPDVLLPYLKKFDLEKERYQSIWIDVKTSAEQASGTYNGVITVKEDGVVVQEVPVAVNVWNFALPRFLTFPIAVGNAFRHTSKNSEFAQMYAKGEASFKEAQNYLNAEEEPDLQKLSPEARRYVRIALDAEKMYQEHHIPARNDFYRGIGKTLPSRLRMQNKAERALYCLGNPYDFKNFIEILRPQVEKARREGSIRYAYVYGFDEARRDEQKRMNKTFGAIKKAFPDLKTMTTAWDYTCGNRFENWKVTDIWVLPTFAFVESLDHVVKARERGQRIWWYTCDYPHPPSASVMLENTGVATRGLVGFLAWKYQAQGYLFYGSTLWEQGLFSENLLENWKKIQGDVKSVSDLKSLRVQDAYCLRSQAQPATMFAEGKVIQKDRSNLHFYMECAVRRFTVSAKSVLKLQAKVQYTDGKTSPVFLLNPDLKTSGWQILKKTFQLEKPVKSVHVLVWLNSPDAEVVIRNAELRIDNITRKGKTALKNPISGGPLLTMPYPDNAAGSWGLPGENAVLPTIRLKLLRDGVEDYEYYFQVAKIVNRMKTEKDSPLSHQNWLKKAQNELEIPSEFGESLTVQTRFGSVLLEARARLAACLEEAVSLGLYHPEDSSGVNCDGLRGNIASAIK